MSYKAWSAFLDHSKVLSAIGDEFLEQNKEIIRIKIFFNLLEFEFE